MSLAELIVASAIFTGIGYVLSLTMGASETSHRTVTGSAELNDAVRTTTETLRDELRAARRSTIVTQDAGGFTTLEFQTAIPSAGALPAWGAFDRSLSPDEAQCAQPGWTVRYVADAALGDSPPLVRQVVDTAGTVRAQATLADAVSQFNVTESGDVWVIELIAVGETGTRREEFDVRTRDL